MINQDDLDEAAREYAETHYTGIKELYGNIVQDFIAGVNWSCQQGLVKAPQSKDNREFMKKVTGLLRAVEKIAEAERMGYGTQRTYGEMAIKALEEWRK